MGAEACIAGWSERDAGKSQKNVIRIATGADFLGSNWLSALMLRLLSMAKPNVGSNHKLLRHLVA